MHESGKQYLTADDEAEDLNRVLQFNKEFEELSANLAQKINK